MILTKYTELRSLNNLAKFYFDVLLITFIQISLQVLLMIAGFSGLILKGFNTNNPAQCGENRTIRFKNPARVQ